MKSKFVLTTVFAVLIFILLPSLLHAQNGPGNPGPDPDVPIDGGLSLLLAAGAAYGIKKVNDLRKRNQSANETENTGI